MSGFGSGIRRGVMAADRFTQIANGLFRDDRISYRAKGLFGCLSTHRDGWQVTVADLARHGGERVDAVSSGLQELEHHGFLLRERDRNPDGTLGQTRYVITDLPALHNPSSPPESGCPGWAEPALADPGTKNTIVKKTNQQKTSPLRPCEPGDAAPANARTAPSRATTSPKPPPADELHDGIRLLLQIGAARPELLLTGPALTDQGRVANVMMDSGWSRAQLRHVITGRPLPHPVRISVGAIIAARLRAAQAYPPRATATAACRTAAEPDELFAAATAQRSPATAASRTVSEALTWAPRSPGLPAACRLSYRGRAGRVVRGGDCAAVTDHGGRPHRERSPHLLGPYRVRRLWRARHCPRRRPLPGLPRLAAVPYLPRPDAQASPPRQRRPLHDVRLSLIDQPEGNSP